jgi:alkylhydroperoxidase family enzyme
MSQDPMFLPDVEKHPKPGPWADSIRAFQSAGKECPQIWFLFAYRPDATEHLARFTQEVMRGPAPLSPGMRELIAAFTSARNNCPF